MRVVIGIAGGANLAGDILTEDACREAAKAPNFDFDEMTGNLYYSMNSGGFQYDGSSYTNVRIEYPIQWLKDADKTPEPTRDTPLAMIESLGHLAGKDRWHYDEGKEPYSFVSVPADRDAIIKE
jgi:hypothetical protein